MPACFFLAFCLLATAYFSTAQAADNSNPRIASGTGQQILIIDQGSVTFQHDLNRTFNIQVLDGTWNATDCALSVTERGGSLYFTSHNLTHIQLFQYGDTGQTHNTYYKIDEMVTVVVDGMELSTITAGRSWNGTIPSTGQVYIQWGWSLLLPHEQNFLFYIGMAGLGMLLGGIALAVYSFRHYKFFTLGSEETVWEKDALMFAVVLIIMGICLIFAWFFAGV